MADVIVQAGMAHDVDDLFFQAAEDHVDAVGAQPFHDVMDDLVARRVELVDAVRDDQEVPGAGVGGYGFQDGVFEVGYVGENSLSWTF